MNTSSPTAALPVVPPPLTARIDRRNAVTLKLLFIAGLVLLLQLPLYWVGSLRQERAENRNRAFDSRLTTATTPRTSRPAASPSEVQKIEAKAAIFVDAYRMVERSLKYGVLVLALVFAAFFIFETVAGLRVHAFHYILIGAALCLFYMALLAFGEVIDPGLAYFIAAGSSSLLITLYSASVLRAWLRAGVVAGLLAAVHSVLFVVLRMEDFALLAGTGALFAALAAIMYFTRNVDWYAHDTMASSGKEQAATS